MQHVQYPSLLLRRCIQAGGLEYLVQQLFLSVDDVTSGPEVAAVARVIKKSAIALSRYQEVRQCSL
jgi:hypothetical protein